MHFLCFAFLKLSKPEKLFQKQDFSIWIKWKTGLKTSKSDRAMKKFVLKRAEKW